MERNSSSALKHIDSEWYKTVEGDLLVQQLSCPKRARKHFGLLERPNLAAGTPEITFKIGVLGKAGSGKTKAVSFLSGKPVTFPGYIETIGIHVKDIYWPVQLQGKISLFKLQFWESGESCSKKYNYISSACLENADALAIVVNRANRTSLDYADTKLEILAQENAAVVLFVMDTDQDVQIHDQELSQYARRKRLPSFHLPPHTLDIKYFAPFFNSLCDFLYASKLKANSSIDTSFV